MLRKTWAFSGSRRRQIDSRKKLSLSKRRRVGSSKRFVKSSKSFANFFLHNSINFFFFSSETRGMMKIEKKNPTFHKLINRSVDRLLFWVVRFLTCSEKFTNFHYRLELGRFVWLMDHKWVRFQLPVLIEFSFRRADFSHFPSSSAQNIRSPEITKVKTTR